MSQAPASTPPPEKPVNTDFSRAAEEDSPGLLREFGDFLLYNKKWWLTPIILVLLLVAVVLVFGGAAPFIYTLF